MAGEELWLHEGEELWLHEGEDGVEDGVMELSIGGHLLLAI